MTPKQKYDYNSMRNALIAIKSYQTPDKLRKDSEKEWGLDYQEALEMSYENIQEEARQGLRNTRQIK